VEGMEASPIAALKMLTPTGVAEKENRFDSANSSNGKIDYFLSRS